MKGKIVIFVNGLPLNGQFKETIEMVHNIINKYNHNIVPCFNSFNLIRTKISAFKNETKGKMNSKIFLKM